MSVRNQYPRNYSKISPMPLTSNQLADARNAVRRRNMYRAPEEADDSFINEAINSKVTKKITDVKSNGETDDIFHVRKNDQLKKTGSDVTIYGKNELNKLVSKSSLNKAKKFSSSENKVNKMKNQEIKSIYSIQRPVHVDNTNTKSRPKSARPDSRWERRADEEIVYTSDEEAENSQSPVRGLSARPESRIVRLLETENSTDVPDRPKTGHRQRDSTGSRSDKTNYTQEHKETHERPKSRRGNTKEKRRSSGESLDGKQEIAKDSHTRQVRLNNQEDDTVFQEPGYHIGISTFYPDLLDKIQGMDDINVQIDDIDQNVDPVVFFNQDNFSRRETSAKKRTSLSKGAISVITNDKHSLSSKPAIGFQGNNQNKLNSAPEVIDRFHRNKVLSLQNSIADDNQRHFNYGRHERIKSDSLTGKSASGENVFISRTNGFNVESLLTTGVLGKRETDMNKQLSNQDNLSIKPKKYNLPATRKPRKLKPLSPVCLEE